MNNDLVAYYHERAKEYEKIYSKPERRVDLKQSTGILQDIFKGTDVLEICCGTGYWTKEIAMAARTVLATDINDTMLEIARHKVYENHNVTFDIADIYNYQPPHQFDHLFGGFIWSHILLQNLPLFLQKVSGFVKKGAAIVFMDNNFVAGSNLPIAYTDVHGNTYQERILNNGTTHMVIKNFPASESLRAVMQEVATDIEIINLKYFWIMKCRLGT